MAENANSAFQLRIAWFYYIRSSKLSMELDFKAFIGTSNMNMLWPMQMGLGGIIYACGTLIRQNAVSLVLSMMELARAIPFNNGKEEDSLKCVRKGS